MAWCGEESLFYWGKTMLLFSAESPDPFPGPYSRLSLWLYVRCCLSCWLMKLWDGAGPGWQEASALIYILQLGQWLALWPAELWCNRFPGCVWIAAASQSQPGMCGCEHMAQWCLLPMHSSMCLLTRAMMVIGILCWRNLWSMWLRPQNKTIENK